MASKEIDIETPDGVCDAYISCPDAGGPFPAVLIYMDAVGVRPALKEMADRIAAKGFYVLLPNMFYRDGRAPVMDPTTLFKPENRPRLMELVGSLTAERADSDAGAFLDFLSAQKEVAPGSQVGITGYCMGGGLAVRTAAKFPDRIAAAASFHAGRLATDSPNSPHTLLGAVEAELYFGHADKDEGMNAEQIARLEAALEAAGVRYRSELYEGALHGYTMPDLPIYNQAAAERHWDNLLGLLDRTLKAA
jgi:carboxymethylenebutenolidase